MHIYTAVKNRIADTDQVHTHRVRIEGQDTRVPCVYAKLFRETFSGQDKKCVVKGWVTQTKTKICE